MESGTPTASPRTEPGASRAPRAPSARPADGQYGTAYSSWKRAKKEAKMTRFQDEYAVSYCPSDGLAEGARGAREAPGSVRGDAVGVPESINMSGMSPVLSK